MLSSFFVLSIFGYVITLKVIEIILLFFCAVILGVIIHFTIYSRRNLKASMSEKDEMDKVRDEWKSRYFNDIEIKDKEISDLRLQFNEIKQQTASLKEQLADAEENVNIYSIEAEEMRKENKKLVAEIEVL